MIKMGDELPGGLVAANAEQPADVYRRSMLIMVGLGQAEAKEWALRAGQQLPADARRRVRDEVRSAKS
jgi:hypothetical protein